MEHIDSSDFSDEQKEIIQMRVDGVSLSSIISTFNARHSANAHPLTKQALIHCLERSAEALRWTKGMKGGTDYYLSSPDFAKLKNKVFECAQNDDHLDPEGLLNEAFELKKARVEEGIQFLNETGSPNLADKLEAKPIFPPVRSWVNKRLEELESSLKYRRLIDTNRLLACTPDHLLKYHSNHAELMKNTPPALIFGADETMLDTSFKTKVITPDHTAEIIAPHLVQIPHLTSMCCHNVIGEKLPPFLILSDLSQTPTELKPFIDRGQIWLSSSPSGWQTRDTFLFWSLCFINWLSSYRLKLGATIRDATALLIMDGHVSRENPVALWLFNINHINVLIMPSHCSHVLQMFDVGLASPLKRKYGKILRMLLLSIDRTLPIAPQIRQAIVIAFLDAWSTVCNIPNVRAAAKITGTYPCNSEPIVSNRFVRPLTAALERLSNSRKKSHEFTINEKVITEEVIIIAINDKLKEHDKWKHLCLRDSYPTYDKFCNEAVKEEHNGCKMLGPLAPFILPSIKPIVFY